MFKETKCPVCNALMVGTITNGDVVMYLCPNHSFGLTTGKASGIHMHLSEEVIAAGEAIRNALFTNLKD